MSVRKGNSLVAIGNVQVDGDTVSFNSNNSLQAKGVINKNESQTAVQKLYDWVGTTQEYQDQNIERDHPEWICFITDDTTGGTIYTAAQCDDRFYTKTASDALLADKVNTDADNFTDAGTTLVSGLGRFSYRFEQLVPNSLGNYTAPANGFFALDGIIANQSGNRLYLLLKNKPYMNINRSGVTNFGALAAYRQYLWLPVSKGDVVGITVESTASSPDFNLYFFYADGVPTESPTFTEVEYIQGTYNTQYIKTRVIPASDLKLYCKIQTTGNGFYGLGARNVDTYGGLAFTISTANQNTILDWFGATASDRWIVNTSVATTDIFELTIENNVAILAKNGTNIATHTFTPTSTISRELYLTAFDNNGALGTGGTTGRLYAFKLWTPDNELLLDMVPAKDGSGVACVYNSVTDTLYYNQGTGTYTAGPEI